MDLADLTLQNSPQGLINGSIEVFDQIRGPEIPITLRHLLYVDYRNADMLLLLILINFKNKIIETVMKSGKRLNRSRNTGNKKLS